MRAAGVSRRRFLQAAAVTTGAVAFSGCAAGPNAFRVESRAQLAEDSVSASEAWYATACAECSAGCGVLVRVVEGRARKIEGNPDHPVNRGKLCARGQAALQAQYNPDRLRGPRARNGAGLSWDEALRTLAEQLDGARGRIAIVTRPLGGNQAQLVDRFASGLGAQWLRLETVNEEPLRAAVKRVFGQDSMPEFDLASAGCVLSFGADFLGDWLSPVHYSAAYGQFRQGSYRAGDFHPQNRPRGHLVQVEPRFSGSAAAADEWLPVKPGTEGLLALSIAQAIVSSGGGGADAALYGGASGLEQYSPEAVAAPTGIAADRIHKVADDFTRRGPSLAIGGGSAGAHTNGADALAAILGLNLLAGSPNIRFNGPGPAGLPGLTPASSLAEWVALVERLKSGAIQALLVQDANPVYELPAALGFAAALAKTTFTASFSAFLDETAQLAHLVLPVRLPLEDWGDAVADPAPGLPVVTIRQPILQPLYGSRSFWDMLLSLGRQLKLADWPAGSFHETLGDTARQLARSGSAGDFERFWTELRAKGFWTTESSGLSRESLVPAPQPVSWTEPRFDGLPSDYPYYLQVFPHNSLGRGRGANLPWMQALPDPISTVVWQTWVEVSPRLGFKEGDVVRLETSQGAAELPVYVNPAAAPDVLSVPLGQGHTAYGRYAEKRGIKALDLLAPLTDATTGSLAYAATRARLLPTGRRAPLPKFEGDVPAYQIPGKEVLEVRHET
ncbi:MAG TPA: molybdopterin-dependent oxidoreductase [Chloroflexota bacterium]